MTRNILYSKQFKKDVERIAKRGLDLEELKNVIRMLQQGKKLDAKYKNHPLAGEFEGTFDCHIKPDWILVYSLDDTDLVLTCIRTGTHSDLF